MITKDGLNLFVHDWVADSKDHSKGSVLIVHGIGEHTLRYSHVAEFFNSLGFDVRGYDQRGFGRSEGKKSFLNYDNVLLDDLRDVFDSYAEERKNMGDGHKPLVLGHSMGGCVVAGAVTGGLIHPRGMILSSPGLIPRLTGTQKFILKILTSVAPDLGFPGGLPLNRLTHDKNIIKKVITDPYCHGIVTARIIKFMIVTGAKAIKDAKKVSIPVLMLVSGNDYLVEPAGSVSFHNNLVTEPASIRVYPELYHELFNELPAEREKIFNDLQKWMEKLM